MTDLRQERNQVVRWISFHISLLLVLSSNSSFAQAQEDDVKSKCSGAIAQAQTRLESGRNLQVKFIDVSSFEQQYEGYPRNAPFSVSLGLEGQEAANVLRSKKMLTSIAQDLINQCAEVSLVRFGRYRTDENIIFGFVSSRVLEFPCRYFGRANVPDKLPWGSAHCQ